MESNDDSGIYKLISFLMIVPVGLALDGWVFSQMWNWLIQPLVHFEISKVHAIGLVVFVYAITSHLHDPDSNSKKDVWDRFIFKVLSRLLFLLEAYCLYSWCY